MKQFFKLIWQTMLGALEKTRACPRGIVASLRLRRRRGALNLLELERLDRIRHPSKYLGKP